VTRAATAKQSVASSWVALLAAAALAPLCVPACASSPAPDASAAASTGGGADPGVAAAGVGGASPDPTSVCVVDDGICDPAETCECADCKGRVKCGLATCEADGVCSPSESCLCAECALLPKCEHTCLFDDGPCTAAKSCSCDECASVPDCAQLDYTCTTGSPGGCTCVDDGICDPAIEPCTCAGCEVTGNPIYPGSCSPLGCDGPPDGTCTWLETCPCADCASDPRCAAQVGACDGGDPDGVCADGESCDCPDCALLGKCVVPYCLPQSFCGLAESCICPGCPGDPGCLNVKSCVDDGACAPWEGCYCIDCASAPECEPLAEGCAGNVPDGTCQAGETCACLDCLGTDACVTCDGDGTCDPMEACLCDDCKEPLVQAGPGIWNLNPCFAEPCVDDGVCQPFREICACSDCHASSWCADDVASCAGAPDGTCAAAEPCGCVDCWGKGKCISLQCTDNGVCEPGKEHLVCEDCAGLGAGCSFADVYCIATLEGCECPECADAPTCQP
jgi:hypothetical protein